MAHRCGWTGRRRGRRWRFRRRSSGCIEVRRNIYRRSAENVEKVLQWLSGTLCVLCISAVYFLWLGKAEGGADGFGYAGYLLHCGGGHFFAAAAFAQNQPDARAVYGFVVADRAGELGDF